MKKGISDQLFWPVLFLLYSPGDTIHLSDIDMIAGTPVLDIKPYIPEYDSPSMRRGTELCDSKTEQPPETTVSLDGKTDDSDLQKDSDLSDIKTQRPGDIVMKNLSSRGNPEADVPVTKSSQTLKHLHNVLTDVKAYVAQHDVQVEEQVSNSPKTESVGPGLDPPRYGEETYSTIAGWIREPPVSSLEVRFTPHAERELARFLPTHLSSKTQLQFCKAHVTLLSTRGCNYLKNDMKMDIHDITVLLHVTQVFLRVMDPGSSFSTVQRKLPLPSGASCLLTHGQFTEGHAAKTDSSSSPWIRPTSPAGLDQGLLKYCKSAQLSNTQSKRSIKWLRWSYKAKLLCEPKKQNRVCQIQGLP